MPRKAKNRLWEVVIRGTSVDGSQFHFEVKQFVDGKPLRRPKACTARIINPGEESSLDLPESSDLKWVDLQEGRAFYVNETNYGYVFIGVTPELVEALLSGAQLKGERQETREGVLFLDRLILPDGTYINGRRR